MPSIVSYQKYIDTLTTRTLRLPEGENHQFLGTELATIDGVTYVSLPDGTTMPDNQPTEIASSITPVTLTDALRNQISDASPHVRLIRERVRDKIAAQYGIADEIKLLRTAPSAEFEAYNAFAEDCRAWGRAKKAVLGL